jgi:hypothetical protein
MNRERDSAEHYGVEIFIAANRFPYQMLWYK